MGASICIKIELQILQNLAYQQISLIENTHSYKVNAQQHIIPITEQVAPQEG